MASEITQALIDRLEAWADAEREYGHVGKADDFEDAAKVIRTLEADRAAVAELVEALSEMLAYSNGRTNPAHAKASAILSRHQAGMKDKDHG